VLEQQAGEEPAGRIVQTDQLADMIPGAFVVPGAEILFGEELSRGIFDGKDTERVYEAAVECGQLSDEETDRFQKDGHTVHEEHKDRGISHAGFFPAAEGLQGGKQYFQAPSEDAAMKISYHKFFHGNSIAGIWKNILQACERGRAGL